ncbi:hypothetical protein LOK49_LG12G02251 [Camellia lanceoleosa]|uniref:Uncharacterized protein n=1 Tax=Camellia lanceoleosa TaxID=1840588 RepID=A0ACC0FSL9_9ERIC|nr:hypothetical protein LOK49_LG12G02251 [Camellia lanceoleosa]
MRLVRLTNEHPQQYPLDYSFPSREEALNKSLDLKITNKAVMTICSSSALESHLVNGLCLLFLHESKDNVFMMSNKKSKYPVLQLEADFRLGGGYSFCCYWWNYLFLSWTTNLYLLIAFLVSWIMKAWKVINPQGGTEDAEEKGIDDDSSHGFWRSHFKFI